MGGDALIAIPVTETFWRNRVFKPRVYLAGPWVERDKAKEYAAKLEAAGFEITHKWWDYEGEDQDKETQEFLEDCAYKDLTGVYTANVVIVINSVKSEGKAVETGMALAWNKPITLVGKNKNNIFYNLSIIEKVDTLDEAIKSAKEYWNGVTKESKCQ